MNLNNQNTEKGIEMLSGQARLYSWAKIWTYFLFLGALLPIFIKLGSPYFSDLKEWIAIIGIGGLTLVFLLDQYISKSIEKAAKIQEHFDRYVYEWEWNSVSSGKQILRTEFDSAAGNYVIPNDRLPWYTPDIENISDRSIQVLLCMRENVIWDWRLKQKFGSFLGWTFFILIIIVVAFGLYPEKDAVTLWTWLISFLVPASGLLYKIFKLWQSFNEVGKIQRRVYESIEVEIEGYINDKKKIPEERLKLFQSQIFGYRKKPALVPDTFFWLHKKLYQAKISKFTKDIIAEIL